MHRIVVVCGYGRKESEKLRKCVIEEQSKHYYIGQRIECLTFTALKRLAFRLSSQGYGVSIIGLSDIEDHVLTITAGKEQNVTDK